MCKFIRILNEYYKYYGINKVLYAPHENGDLLDELNTLIESDDEDLNLDYEIGIIKLGTLYYMWDYFDGIWFLTPFEVLSLLEDKDFKSYCDEYEIDL